MSRLHKRFPRYFYKRGNLFNTYLGQTDDASPPGEAARRRRETPGLRRSSEQSTPRNQVDELIAFAQLSLSAPDAARMLRLLARRSGVPVTIGRDRQHSQLADFVRHHVDDATAGRYLAALRKRRDAGEPLIRFR
jgi:hypothetical protein